VPVLVGVVFAGFFGVMSRVHVMSMRHVCVMTSLFVVAGFVMVGGLVMMFRGVRVVLSCFAVMFRGFF
jgi:hypothetical protein